MAKIHDSDFSKRPRRRVGWKRIFVISFIVFLALVGFGVPQTGVYSAASPQRWLSDMLGGPAPSDLEDLGSGPRSLEGI